MDKSVDSQSELTIAVRPRETTVLFADMIGISKLYAVANDLNAVELIARCRNGLRDVIQSEGGRILRTMGERLMAIFPTPDSAALASTKMHLAIEGLPARGVKLGLRVAFHQGPLIQREDEVFGETVDTAARMLEYAIKGQTLLHGSCLPTLSPIMRACVRQFDDAPDNPANTTLELAWRQNPDITDLGARPASAPLTILRLNYKGQTVIRRRMNEALIIGRDESNDVVVPERKASRQHCTIERRPNGFVLRDHSTNGTYIVPTNEKEMFLLRADMTLRGAGILTLGQPRSETAEAIEYSTERAAE